METMVVFVAGAEDYTLTDAFPIRIGTILRRIEEDGVYIIIRCMQSYSGKELLEELAEDCEYGFSVAESEREVMDANMLVYFDDGDADQQFLTLARARTRVKLFPVGSNKRLRNH